MKHTLPHAMLWLSTSRLSLASASLIAAASSWIDPRSMLVDYAPTTQATYDQLVDHFSYSVRARTFKQRYWVYDKFWDGKGPILFFFSGEGQLETFYSDTTVLFSSIGPELHGLIVFLEHRYYGKSKVQDNVDLQYLTVENALQDTAEFLVHFRDVNNCGLCPTFVFGGSYGGMLVGWFRMKYPHLTSGGVVSSGSLDFYDIEQIPRQTWENALSAWYYEGGMPCYDAVKRAFDVLQKFSPENETKLVQLFNVCVDGSPKSRLPGAGLPALIRYLKGGIATLSMIDYPFQWGLTTEQPARPVKHACEKLVQQNDDLGLLSALSQVVENYTGPSVKCKNIELELFNCNGTSGLENKRRSGLDMELWNYQACTQIPMMPLSTDLLGFFPPENEKELDSLQQACAKRYKVQTRKRHLPLTYGGRLKASDKVQWTDLLTRVVIVDGALDTWRTGSLGFEVHHNTSDFVVIPPARGSAHHQDLIAEHSSDSPELKEARRVILETLKRWLAEDTRRIPTEAPWAASVLV